MSNESNFFSTKINFFYWKILFQSLTSQGNWIKSKFCVANQIFSENNFCYSLSIWKIKFFLQSDQIIPWHWPCPPGALSYCSSGTFSWIQYYLACRLWNQMKSLVLNIRFCFRVSLPSSILIWCTEKKGFSQKRLTFVIIFWLCNCSRCSLSRGTNVGI